MQQYQNKQTLTATPSDTNINGETIQLSAAEIGEGGSLQYVLKNQAV
jgi:hypothetical protein